MPEFHLNDRVDFTVVWDEGAGSLPHPIRRLFRRAEPGFESLTITTDPGHAAYYTRAIDAWIANTCPERADITTTTALRPDSDEAITDA